MQSKKPKNISELRDQMLDAFQLVKKDPKKHRTKVIAMTHVADSVIGTVKAQLQYAVIRNEEPDIAFMGKTSGRPIKGARLLPAA